MFGNAGHRLFVFDCCSPKIAGAYIASAIWSRSVPHGQSPTGPYPATHERFDHPTDMGSDESVRPTSLFPCLATDVHHVGGLFTFQTFTRPLHDLYTKLSPGASNQSSHYFKNLGQLRKKTPWTCLERRRLLQFCVEQPVWR